MNHNEDVIQICQALNREHFCSIFNYYMERKELSTAMYRCPRCGRINTVEEFREDRFCRGCGRLLRDRDRRVTDDVERGFMRFFPYTPYPQQLEFMKDAERVLSGGGVLVAEACNGFGKTVCALSVALSLGRRIVYATRTHEQVRQVLREIERINIKAGTEFSAVSLASRQNLCINDVCRRLPPLEAVEACNTLRKTGRCPYRSTFNPKVLSSLPLILSASRLISYGRTHGYCPYFMARRAAEECTVVVAPYQYIFNEAVRVRVKLEIAGKTLIFDEAHNADKVGQDALSDILSERTLKNAERELNLINGPTEFIHDLTAYIEESSSKEPTVKDGGELRRDLEEILGGDLERFSEDLDPMVEEIRLKKIQMGKIPICYLNGLLHFLSLVGSSEGSSYVAIYRRTRTGMRIIEYRCLDPSLALKPVIEEAYGALIMSGTLSPLNFFTDIMGLGEAEARTYMAIQKPENIQTFIDTSVTTRFKERDKEMLRLYGERISQYIMKIPNGTLIFFPQRKLMLDAVKIWLENNILQKINGKLYLKDKEVFIEGERALENTRIVDAYRESAKDRGAVLLAVFRGRNAEGSNFPYEEARGIFLIGLPYADYRDPIVRAQIRYFNNKAPHLGERWYVMDAFRAANQALGRGIRHIDDWCIFFLMDKRYASYWRFISEWARIGGIRRI